MIRFNRIRLIISVVVLSVLTGCGLKSYFPDKEKDYQSRQEIAPLTVPLDLSDYTFKRLLVKPENDENDKIIVMFEAEDSEVEDSEVEDSEVEDSEVEDSEVEDSEVEDLKIEDNKTDSIEEVNETGTVNKENTSNSPDVTEAINLEAKVIQVDFVMFDGGATRLRTNENFSPVWRLVAKTLSRNLIEITSRNKVGGQFIVQYDPDKKDFIDGGIKNEFLFVFTTDHSQEKEYRIRLIKHNKAIEIMVLNDENQPLSDGAGLKLLKLLFSTLHRELVTQK